MKKKRHGGFTLLELMLALMIIAVVSVAVTSLLVAGAKSSSYVTSTNDTVWQVDNACRRMAFNLRMASTLDSPTTTTPAATFMIHTQKDPPTTGTVQQVSYAIDGSNNLTETDARYGTSTLVTNATLSVTRNSTTSPTSLQITITAGTTTQVTRTFTVLCRNL